MYKQNQYVNFLIIFHSKIHFETIDIITVESCDYRG